MINVPVSAYGPAVVAIGHFDRVSAHQVRAVDLGIVEGKTLSRASVQLTNSPKSSMSREAKASFVGAETVNVSSVSASVVTLDSKMSSHKVLRFSFSQAMSTAPMQRSMKLNWGDRNETAKKDEYYGTTMEWYVAFYLKQSRSGVIIYTSVMGFPIVSLDCSNDKPISYQWMYNSHRRRRRQIEGSIPPIAREERISPC